MVDYFSAAIAPLGGKVYAANSNPYAAAFGSAAAGFVVPGLHDPLYIDTLIQICHEYEIEAIIPLFDLELPVLAEARERMASEGIRAIVSSPNVVKTCYDKWQTKSFLDDHRFLTPQAFASMDPVLEALAAKTIEFPLVLKPRWGTGSIGVMEVEDEKDLQQLYGKVVRAIETSYLSAESSEEPKRAVLITEKLGGYEYGLDVVNDLHGNYITTFPKKKIAMRSGETDIAMTVDHPDLMQLGHEIAEKLGHIANLDVDVVVTQKGMYVLDMNPRFGGGYPFSHLAGANLPAAIVAWLHGEPADPANFQMAADVIGFKGLLPLKAASIPIEVNRLTGQSVPGIGKSYESGTHE